MFWPIPLQYKLGPISNKQHVSQLGGLISRKRRRHEFGEYEIAPFLSLPETHLPQQSSDNSPAPMQPFPSELGDPAPTPSLDLNRSLNGSRHEAGEPDCCSYSVEAEKTAEIGQQLGFEIESGETHKITWVRRLKNQHHISYIGPQETQLLDSDDIDVAGCWGLTTGFDFATIHATGRSGGILSIWDNNLYRVDQVLMCRGSWTKVIDFTRLMNAMILHFSSCVHCGKFLFQGIWQLMS
ncbi:unnamed protein product [Lactuca saligna]|uniref:Uncharacterized protein n=1 Tax=Lactuca saligna TaxID=75948 RepID=A0AA35Y5S8_LACSI|nr:unnamed protein product [Lactuca saligna]